MAGRAQMLHQAQAVDAGQHAIDDQRVERLARGAQQARAAVGRDLGAVAALAQALGEVFRRIGVVFDDQNTHGNILGAA